MGRSKKDTRAIPQVVSNLCYRFVPPQFVLGLLFFVSFSLVCLLLPCCVCNNLRHSPTFFIFGKQQKFSKKRGSQMGLLTNDVPDVYVTKMPLRVFPPTGGIASENTGRRYALTGHGRRTMF